MRQRRDAGEPARRRDERRAADAEIAGRAAGILRVHVVLDRGRRLRSRCHADNVERHIRIRAVLAQPDAGRDEAAATVPAVTLFLISRLMTWVSVLPLVPTAIRMPKVVPLPSVGAEMLLFSMS